MQYMGRMTESGGFFSPFEIFLEHGLIIGMGTFVDDDPGPFFGAETAHVRQTAFGHEDLGIMFRVIHMRAHGHDGRDVPPFSNGTGAENG